MQGILDNILVGVVLLVSVSYAAMSLGPKSLRRNLLNAASRLMARAPAAFGLRRAAERLAIAAAGKAHGACGGCESCGSEQPTAQPPPQPDVRIPVTKIGRRA
jgi:hypothetical protein